jgi:hypothetical protein
LSWDTTDIPGL